METTLGIKSEQVLTPADIFRAITRVETMVKNIDTIKYLDPLLTRKEVAKKLNMSVRTLDDVIINDPNFPLPQKFSKQDRFRRKDIEKYLDERFEQ